MNKLLQSRGVAGAVAGVLAAGLALGSAQLAAGFIAAESSPVVAVGSAFIDITPRWLKEFAIRTFGENDKIVLLAGIVVTLALFAVAVGIVAVRRLNAGILGVGMFGIIGAAAVLSRPTAEFVHIVPSLVGAAFGSAALALLVSRIRRPDRTAYTGTAAADGTGPAAVTGPAAGTGPAGGSGRLSRLSERLTAGDRKGVGYDRRGFLLTSLAVGGAAAASGTAGRQLLASRFSVSASRGDVKIPTPASPAPPVPAGTALTVDGLPRYYTRNADFYRVDTNLVVPKVSPEQWRLKVHGMVDNEIALDFQQLLERRLIERDITLTCVSNEVGGPYVGTARWIGAPLRDLLREAGVDRRADQLVSRSVDGFSIGTPTRAVMDGRDAMLAVAMNGEPLPIEHGFPVRMVVPGLYGYVSATKWVVDLELTTFDAFDAYWVERKWSREGPIKTMSRIDTPRPLAGLKSGKVAVAGVAYAQQRGIDKVEVRVDGGEWNPARLSAENGIDTWRQWVWQWDATPGQHTLEVRATDRTGATQPSARANPFPNGATGWHSVVVIVS